MFLPLTLLVLASLVLAVKTAQVVKDKQIILSQLKVKGSAATQQVKAMTDVELITARQMIEGYAALYALPVEVKLEKRDIRIKVKEPQQESAATGTPLPEVAKPEKTASTDKTRLAVLENFGNVMGFFTSISKMPYPLEYKDFCVGVDCPTVFDVTISPKAAGEQQPVAPTAPRQPA